MIQVCRHCGYEQRTAKEVWSCTRCRRSSGRLGGSRKSTSALRDKVMSLPVGGMLRVDPSEVQRAAGMVYRYNRLSRRVVLWMKDDVIRKAAPMSVVFESDERSKNEFGIGLTRDELNARFHEVAGSAESMAREAGETRVVRRPDDILITARIDPAEAKTRVRRVMAGVLRDRGWEYRSVYLVKGSNPTKMWIWVQPRPAVDEYATPSSALAPEPPTGPAVNTADDPDSPGPADSTDPDVSSEPMI
jgi:hypothetical protein